MSKLNLPESIRKLEAKVSNAVNYSNMSIFSTAEMLEVLKALADARDKIAEVHKDLDTLGVPKSTLHGRLNLLVGSYEAERAELKAELERLKGSEG